MSSLSTSLEILQAKGSRLRACIQQQALGFRARSIPKGSCIYTSGSRDDNIYFIESGQVAISLPTESGKVCLLSILTEGDVFGELCLTGANRMEMATARKVTVLRQMPCSLFLDGLRREGVLEDFTKYLAAQLSEQQQVITDLVTASSELRMAATLLRLGRKLGKADSRSPHNLRIDMRISCQELSEMVGTTRSRVGYFLKKFRELGLIATGSKSFLMLSERRLLDYLHARSLGELPG